MEKVLEGWRLDRFMATFGKDSMAHLLAESCYSKACDSVDGNKADHSRAE